MSREKQNGFQFILFDLDGTLTDPKVGITSCVQYALHKMGIEEPDLNKLEPFIGPPLLDSFEEFYGFTKEQAEQAITAYRERFSTIGLFENEVYPGIPAMLEHLQEQGKKLAIASSKPTVFVKRILEHFDMEKYFDVIVGSELNGALSRKEEVVEEALRQLHHGEKEAYDTTVMVGDRKFDVFGAKEFGLTSIGVSFGYAAEGELAAAGADYIVDSVEQLECLLQHGGAEASCS